MNMGRHAGIKIMKTGVANFSNLRMIVRYPLERHLRYAIIEIDVENGKCVYHRAFTALQKAEQAF